ncbi:MULTISPECIES: protein-methionine-sulfoxide reductase catalytic subunit MsrP [Acidiphilium]|jgi:sulfoxide reductase catalytic subunit YedY|uniref:protein-methionine-sulfoxide reductase catalytic subunit MsrP n=1 Tax=Acidiphilium TaxID=522 RepID=UPI0002144F28|nr:MULTISPECIES: protein-methionine-sulfoxide reductase catalytic subunit MsrP [Acidiphilium]EGO94918.1 Putative sulfite oxidase subunit YedY [Acidiphilium sp. PM]KDM66678.1 putative sulfite oxidase subunit YedY [Acidiphilium sp. JA12-A1]MBS3023947.1 protein-methionine-sulfoxide reductase catalytic subunit MsrP [Acidiphilium multivorum]
MHVIRKPDWSLPETEATPPHLALDRRAALATLGGAMLGFGQIGAALADTNADANANAKPGDRISDYPPSAARFDPERSLTPRHNVETYNNFYEFGLNKDIWRKAQKLPTEPWTIRIDGMVEKPFTISFDDLMKKVSTETRIYRHRCVEAWSLVVPWEGFPLADLVKLAKPLSGAKYLRFTTLSDPKVMPGLSIPFFPWPYHEGLTMAEATNELAFVGTGMYGAKMPRQDGAPIRVVLPWKYGFKSAKSLVRIEFVKEQPVTFWEKTSPDMYGFWANVNPKYPTLRWSQARERVIGTGEVVPTQIYNGYGKWVAPLYAGMKQDKKLFM